MKRTRPTQEEWGIERRAPLREPTQEQNELTLPLDVIEFEIARRATYETQLALSGTCKHMYQRRFVRDVPLSVQMRLRDSLPGTFPYLEILRLSAPPWTVVSALPHLRWLNMSDATPGPQLRLETLSGLQRLAIRLPSAHVLERVAALTQLTRLAASFRHGGAVSTAPLAALTNLRSLQLIGVSPENAAFVTALVHLEVLEVSDPVREWPVSIFERLTRLVELKVPVATMTQLRVLERLTSFTALSITTAEADGGPALQFPHLRRLKIDWPGNGGHFAGITGLTSLRTNATATNGTWLARLGDLRRLDVDTNGDSIALAMHTRFLPALQRLRVFCTEERGSAHLFATFATLTRLDVTSIQGVQVSHLAGLPLLRRLRMQDVVMAGDGVSNYNALNRGLQHLEVLELRHVTHQQKLRFGGLLALRQLIVAQCSPLEEESLAALTHLTHAAIASTITGGQARILLTAPALRRAGLLSTDKALGRTLLETKGVQTQYLDNTWQIHLWPVGWE